MKRHVYKQHPEVPCGACRAATGPEQVLPFLCPGQVLERKGTSPAPPPPFPSRPGTPTAAQFPACPLPLCTFPSPAPWDSLLGRGGLHPQAGHLGHEGPEEPQAQLSPLTQASEGSHRPGQQESGLPAICLSFTSLQWVKGEETSGLPTPADPERNNLPSTWQVLSGL